MRTISILYKPSLRRPYDTRIEYCICAKLIYYDGVNDSVLSWYDMFHEGVSYQNSMRIKYKYTAVKVGILRLRSDICCHY